jgi:hypothetical protein
MSNAEPIFTLLQDSTSVLGLFEESRERKNAANQF